MTEQTQTPEYIVLGSKDCDWPIIPSLMKQKHTIIYSVGVGNNITWDMELIKRFDCEVWGYDPTPKTVEWAKDQEFSQHFKFIPLGLAGHDGYIEFEKPKVKEHVSFSASNDEDAIDTVSCEVRRLKTLMLENGHSQIDVLKIDIEGAEYEVIHDMLYEGIRPKQFMVEFHHGLYGIEYTPTQRAIDALKDAGYERFYISKTGREQGYIYKGTPAKPLDLASLKSVANNVSDKKLDRGVVYFAFGRGAIAEAKLSVASLKKSNPNVGSAIFTDLPGRAREFDVVHKFTRTQLHDIEHYFVEPKRLPSLKVRFLQDSPFRHTIHLDCDTYVKGPLDEFYEHLEKHDFILTNMPELEQAVQKDSNRPVHQSLKTLTRKSAFSCAVFGYSDSEATRELLHTWWTQFVEKTAGPNRKTGNWGHTNGVNEQGILHDMLADGSFSRAGVKKDVLPNIKYNAGMSMWPRLKKENLWNECCVLHSHKIAQSIGDCGVEGLPDLPELQKFL